MIIDGDMHVLPTSATGFAMPDADDSTARLFDVQMQQIARRVVGIALCQRERIQGRQAIQAVGLQYPAHRALVTPSTWLICR